MEKYLYLSIELFSFIVPLVYTFHKRLKFYKNFTSFLLGFSLMFFVFIPWDIWFTDLGVWGFNERYFLGLLIFAISAIDSDSLNDFSELDQIYILYI